MPVILMPLPETAPEISSHKSHTEVFFLLHHHAKFPDQTEALQLYHAKPPDRTSPSSQQEMCSNVQIPYSKFPSFLSRFCIFSEKIPIILILMIQPRYGKGNIFASKNSAYIFLDFLSFITS